MLFYYRQCFEDLKHNFSKISLNDILQPSLIIFVSFSDLKMSVFKSIYFYFHCLHFLSEWAKQKQERFLLRGLQNHSCDYIVTAFSLIYINFRRMFYRFIGIEFLY